MCEKIYVGGTIPRNIDEAAITSASVREYVEGQQNQNLFMVGPMPKPIIDALTDNDVFDE